MCSKEVGLLAQNMLTILDSTVHIIGEPTWPFDDHKKLHFDYK
jgi:hypothetical protein